MLYTALMTETRPALIWFRQDLRLADNPALQAAIASGAPVLPVYIHDDEAAGEWKPGAAGRWWLHESLATLNESLNGALQIFHGDACEIIPRLAREFDATSAYWNRCYEPWRVGRDEEIKSHLAKIGAGVRSFNGCYLYDPTTIETKSGTPYRVFTPFYRNGCLGGERSPRTPLADPGKFRLFKPGNGRHDGDLAAARLPWDEEEFKNWRPGEAGAKDTLRAFIGRGIDEYDDGRDRPDLDLVSRLSPHLHFGEISPNQVRQAIIDHYANGPLSDSGELFLRQLGWREFSAYLLYHEPDLPGTNLIRKFDRFPWRDDADALSKWQGGKTGFPIVDAGMRQLKISGYMHNRVRMITASFLVKNLLLDWRHGERWFWARLLDADLANNSASWQWVAGCGADAAPYFRIFNPVRQGEKFDPDGEYVRHYVPELKGLPDKYIHCPWDAPAELLATSGVRLGENYPHPLVELKSSRERALSAYRELSSKR